MAVYQADLQQISAEISKLSNEQLKELCNDTSDERYDKLLEQVEQVSQPSGPNISQKRSVYIRTNTSLSRYQDRYFGART